MTKKEKHALIGYMGMISGFTLMMSGNTLNFWLASEKIDLEIIGIFSLISLPYGINFLMAPYMDVTEIPAMEEVFGHRLSWIVLLHTLLGTALYLMSQINPKDNIILFAILGFFISFTSSSLDTVLGALKTEIIDKHEQGSVSGIYILGYRIGMLLSGYGAIYLSSMLSFNRIYSLFSVFILLSCIFFISLFRKVRNTVVEVNKTEKQTLIEGSVFTDKVGQIFKSIVPNNSAKVLFFTIIFLIMYRLPDNFIGAMINPFLIKIGYSSLEIAHSGKLFGTISAIIGGLIAGEIMKKKNIIDCLIIFGIFHSFSHLLFLIQEFYGKNIYILSLTITFEGVTGGMTMAAYIGFIASLCHGKWRATQYSFFSSMMGLSRSTIPMFSGYIVNIYGWENFFIFICLLSFLPIFLIFYVRRLLSLKRIVSG